MRIIETCPECGADIVYEEICTLPPIPVRRCTKCNWRWEGEAEDTVRVPFNPNGYRHSTLELPTGKYILKVPMVAELTVDL